MVRTKKITNKLDANTVTMLDAKVNAQTNDSFTYNKHLGNVYLR
jgi:hypothetical protein